ncbi:polysaccharide deacetylase family protein [Paenibacillus sp. YPG26]|uniref:polysaccharide deacetylase n=1 Tax=Paenibacillus sp. YPG26 TaxID=2878915 RepID=UPI00203E23A3|nr:polysaccharide deacetylase family protein [Paenibacillus sp. YPG26]USB31862.1 polysaccharide deacetylase family protein [Paenibacillus sp. YPG26]
MYKKLTLMIIIVFCMAVVQTAAAAGNHTALLGVNDHVSDIQPELIEGSYYMPVRDLAAVLSVQVAGTPDDIALTDANYTSITLKPPAGIMIKTDGSAIEIKLPVQSGKTLVPVALIAREFGYLVTYQAESRLLRLINAPGVQTDDIFVQQNQDAVVKNKEKNDRLDQEIEAERKIKAEEARKEKLKKEQEQKGQKGRKGQEQKDKPAKQPVYLSFDDGPTAHTDQLLDILNKYEAKATFFMLGNHIDTYSTSVKRLVQEGHQPALHGMTHIKSKFYLSPAAALQEMDADNEHLYRAAKVKSKLIRPPYGSKPYLVQSYRDKLISHGYHLWDWNVDSEDWKYKSNSKAVYNRVMNQVHALHKKGIKPIILFHDQAETLKVLPSVLAELKREGYSFELITPEMTPVNFWHDVR